MRFPLNDDIAQSAPFFDGVFEKLRKWHSKEFRLHSKEHINLVNDIVQLRNNEDPDNKISVNFVYIMMYTYVFGPLLEPGTAILMELHSTLSMETPTKFENEYRPICLRLADVALRLRGMENLTVEEKDAYDDISNLSTNLSADTIICVSELISRKFQEFRFIKKPEKARPNKDVNVQVLFYTRKHQVNEDAGHCVCFKLDDAGNVHVYDSLKNHQKLSPDQKAFFQKINQTKPIFKKPKTQSINPNTCEVFALCYAIQLCQGMDPEKVN